MKILRIFLIIFALAGLNPAGVAADELESLLSGFDDQTPTQNQGNSGEVLGDLLGGFEEGEPPAIQGDMPPALVLPNWLQLSGSVGLVSTLSFSQPAPLQGQPDYRGISLFQGVGEFIGDVSQERWRARVGISMFYDALYHLNNQRDLYTDQFLNLYESEIELDEAYLQARLTSNLDLKIGRQIVVWGKSDSIRVTDILNPLDLRWPGLTDIRFLRMPVTMTKADFYQGKWNLGAILIHEPRFNKFPVYNGEFFPLNRSLPKPDEPGWSWSSQQAALSMDGIFSGWDISFYTAYVFDKQPYFTDLEAGLRQYDKVFFTGSAANVAVGNWLIKGEAAFWDGLRYSNTDEEKNRLDLLVGVDYSGFHDTTISIEMANRHIFDFDDLMAAVPDGQKEDWNQFAFRFTRDYLNDTLHVTMLISSYGVFAREGGFERFQLEYDFSDNVKVTGGVVLYQSGEYPSFKNMGDNDRLLFELEYRF